MGGPQSRVQWTDRGPISMRKTITLLFYLAMVCIGTCCAYEWLVLGGPRHHLPGRRIPGALRAVSALDFLSPNRERI
jgi:hypothetical protein